MTQVKSFPCEVLDEVLGFSLANPWLLWASEECNRTNLCFVSLSLSHSLTLSGLRGLEADHTLVTCHGESGPAVARASNIFSDRHLS